MINREMKSYDWERPVYTLDSYGQEIATNTSLGTVDAAVYFDTQVFKNNPKWDEATHVALTKEKSVEISDIIGDYTVMAVNPIGRLNQLILKEG